MKIAKEFRWEMGHRLSFHEGKCINLHGHSYKMLVELTGAPNEDGIVLDYYDLKEIVAPIVDELDHAFMVKEDDVKVLEFLQAMDSKHVVVGFESTAENICIYLLKRIKNAGPPNSVTRIKVKVFETENTYAEEEIEVQFSGSAVCRGGFNNSTIPRTRVHNGNNL